jgi:hypothetical protein
MLGADLYMHRKMARKTRGHSIAELGPALFLILLIMVLPMACLASLGIRYTIMFYAVRQAAREAAKSSQFQNNQSALQKSAKNRAIEVVQLFANSAGANGLKVVIPTGVNTFADVINISSGAVTRYSAPIPAATPINQSNFVYNITVQVDAEVRPLFEGGSGVLFGGAGGIPGLTKPFPVRIVSAAMCEQPNGLRN